MQHRLKFTLTALAAVVLFSTVGVSSYGQSTGTFAQTVNKAPTVTGIVMPSGMLPNQNVTLKAIVHTGISTSGIAVPGTTVTFTANGASIGTPTLSSSTATNLLPYSEAFSKWTGSNNATSNPVVSDQAVVGPFGITDTPNAGKTASTVAFPATTVAGATSLLSYQITGTSYASKGISFSVWAESATATTLKLIIADGSGGSPQTVTMNVGTSWRRFHVETTLPSTAATGLTATIEATGTAAATVDLFGAQVESGVTSPGVYVQTTGTGGVTGTGSVATFSYAFPVGTSTLVASYDGDNNYLASTSNTLSVVTSQGTATLALATSGSPSTYGTSVTFTASLTGDGSPFASPGVITVTSGGTTIGTCNVTAGATSVQTCAVSTDKLPGGTDTVDATYTGDPNYSEATASVSQTVNAVGATVSMTSTPEPSVYGQMVNFTINVQGVSGLATPTGTVTVVDNGSCTSACTGGTTVANDVTLTAGAASFTSGTLTGGTHNFVITFASADSNYK